MTYSTDWQPIAQAPMGRFETRTAGLKSARKIFIPDWVWTWRDDGHMTPSHWIPDGHPDGGGRWNGYTKAKPPTMFAPYRPFPPEA